MNQRLFQRLLPTLAGLLLMLLPLHAASPSNATTSSNPSQTSNAPTSEIKPAPSKVYVIPIREDIMPPLTYLVRRGVKEAMDAKADLLVLDMDTNGGRVDTTEEIIEILTQFKGDSLTFVNRKAFSAGAFISVATKKIYMAPRSVIGAAAPIIMAPGGGVEDMPSTMEAKMTSGVSALIRSVAESNGYNKDLIDAMVDKNKEFKVGDTVLSEKGSILTLTNQEAERSYGDPPQRLLSSGTFENLDELLAHIGMDQATRVDVKPTGAEYLATWITRLSPLLLLVGMLGIYLEFKTPGFGLPGIVGIIAFVIYFFGGYVAGLSGIEWLAIFFLGLILILLEVFVFTGTLIAGLLGVALILVSLLMANVDWYPGTPGLPSLEVLTLPMTNLTLAFVGFIASIFALGLILPHTPFYRSLVDQGASGMATVAGINQREKEGLGKIGIAICELRPGGKARFDDGLKDVITQGEPIEEGAEVEIVGLSMGEPVVRQAPRKNP